MWPDAVYYNHQYYRLVTAAFLHASFWHIAFNMVTLAIIGSPVEAEVGKKRFCHLPAVGARRARSLPPAEQSHELGSGASGAIFGLIGAYFVLARRYRWDLRSDPGACHHQSALQLADPTIDWRAHLGGLVVGGP